MPDEEERVNDPPPIDPSVLTALLSSLGDRAPVAEAHLIDAYLDELPLVAAALREALESDDRESLHRAVHTLKSSSANMGALRLSQLCGDLEDRSRDAIPAEAAESARHIIDECERVERAFAARRREAPGPG